MRVLMVEDEETSAELLQYALQEFGYEVDVARNGRQAYEMVRTGRYRLVVSDWEMPEMSGVELCRRIRARSTCGYIYIVLLTSRGKTEDIVAGLNAGADDFITKPFQPSELRLRLRTGERILSLEGRDLLIFSLARLAESRDPETGAHLERMREYTRILADHLSTTPQYRRLIDGEYVQGIYLTSPLHDIGKVGIPDHVLLKPGPLTEEEFEIMKQHTVIGGETLGAAVTAHPKANFLRMASEIAWTHHEKYDGSGYPRGLRGDEIPLCGRITALADVYDALTTRRIYKPAFSHQQARSIILDGKGSHFDPVVVDAFLASEEAFQSIRKQFADAETLHHNEPPNFSEPANSGEQPITGELPITDVRPTSRIAPLALRSGLLTPAYALEVSCASSAGI